MPDPTTALVLVNLGTPDAPTARAVRRYLREFLSDTRVVDMPRILWKPLLNLVILPLRSPRVAKKYAKVWLREGSPLAVHTRRLAQAVQGELPTLKVVHAMRYGAQSLTQTLRELRGAGIKRVLVLPLYPQYSTSTTASVGDVVNQAVIPSGARDLLSVHGNDDKQQVPRSARDDCVFAIHMIDEYHLDPQWIAAVADSIRAHRREHGNAAHLLFSFHGLPQRFADAGDPYPQQCAAGARAIASALGLDDAQWTLTYQSRFGREKWLEPATVTSLTELAARGVKRVDIVAPGFAVDCLETLEEVAIQLAEDFAQHGGELRYIPCLNDSPAHARALAALAQAELARWRA